MLFEGLDPIVIFDCHSNVSRELNPEHCIKLYFFEFGEFEWLVQDTVINSSPCSPS
jgi:hypothetical protein